MIIWLLECGSSRLVQIGEKRTGKWEYSLQVFRHGKKEFEVSQGLDKNIN